MVPKSNEFEHTIHVISQGGVDELGCYNIRKKIICQFNSNGEVGCFYLFNFKQKWLRKNEVSLVCI